jgi:hypothetical protein
MDRGLTTIKVIVVVLGLLIVAATVALVMFAFNQAGKPADATTPPASEITVPAATGIPAADEFADVAVALPAGARVVSMIGDGGVLTLLVETPDGAQSIVTLDRSSGEVLGTLELLPRAAGDN